jgi:hypothetical protein
VSTVAVGKVVVKLGFSPGLIYSLQTETADSFLFVLKNGKRIGHRKMPKRGCKSAGI